MKPLLFCAALIFCGIGRPDSLLPASAAPRSAALSPRRAHRLHFARGATTLSVRGFLSGSQHRVYVLKTRAGQRLRISVRSASHNPDSALVPLLFVTPPRGRFNGDKTAIYTSNSTRAGDYQIEIAANSMASTARSGRFILRISAR